MIALILLNLPVFLLALGITHIFFPDLEDIDRLLCIGVIFFSYIVIAQEILGLLGALNLGNLYLLNAAVLLLLLFVIQKNKAALSFRGGLGEAIASFP
jgi:hypothetical protein